MEQCAGWAEQPGPSGFGGSAPERAQGSPRPQGCQSPSPIPIMLQFTVVFASPGLPLQGQRASASVSITAGELRLWKQFNRTKSQTSQTNDPPAFSIAGSPLPAPDVDPGTLEKRREKVTKLSREESEPAKRSLHCSRAAWKASTYHKNRKSQQKEKGSFLRVLDREKSTAEI